MDIEKERREYNSSIKEIFKKKILSLAKKGIRLPDERLSKFETKLIGEMLGDELEYDEERNLIIIKKEKG